MKPIGLTLKHIVYNPFTSRKSGELMIVHLCLNCGKISANRIAGDDNTQSIIDLINEPIVLNTKTLNSFSNLGIILLTHQDREQVMACLFGYHHT